MNEKPYMTKTADPVWKGKVAQHLSQLIQVPTVSHWDLGKMDWQAFAQFKSLLKNMYPLVHDHCELTEVGTTGLLYKWPGQKKASDTQRASVVLMSHYDVVPAQDNLWSKPPFSGIIEAGEIWGRGTLDTKGTLCSIFEAAELLLGSGFKPQQDVYFSFSGDEEISGPSAPAIVSYLKEKGLKPWLVLDEGGAIVEGVFPGLSEPCALVGIGEKGFVNVTLTIKGQGGHASTPPPHTLAGILAQAIVAIENSPFPTRFTPATEEMFKTLGSQTKFPLSTFLKRPRLVKPLIDQVVNRRGGDLNALLRTTCAVTMLEGSKAFNVMPPQVQAGLNLRLLNGDTIESALAHLKKAIANESVAVEVLEGREASPQASTDSDGWRLVNQTIKDNWNNVLVSPYLMIAGTDSRHFCEISPTVLRFSAMKLSGEDRKLIHGNNERIKIDILLEAVQFYVRLIEKL